MKPLPIKVIYLSVVLMESLMFLFYIENQDADVMERDELLK